MGTRDEEKLLREKKAAYHRRYRAKATAEKKDVWKRQRRERRMRQKQREVDNKVRQKRSDYNREYYLKRKAQQSAFSIPATPKSKVKLVESIIENATPSTTAELNSKLLSNSAERKVQTDIVSAAGKVAKDPATRNRLLPHLRSSNKLAVSRRLNISRNHFYYKSQRGNNPKIPEADILTVIDYYKREDVSVTYPNKTRGGQPITILRQSRVDTFKQFKLEFSHIAISQSSFNKLKPKSVKLMKQAKWLQCLCDVCDNISMLVKSIKLSMSRHQFDIPEFFQSEYSLAKATVCDIFKYDCLDRKCSSCAPEMIRCELEAWLSDDVNTPVSYMKWSKVSENIGGKLISKLKKLQASGRRWELYHELVQQLVKYPIHIHNAICQLSSYKKCKATLESDEVVVVMDFAENYVCRQFAEAQSAYYSRNAVTIHPMVVIFGTDSQIKRDSVVIVSNDLKHDASAVNNFVRILGTHISIHYPAVKTLKFWSDGCASQYKSKGPLRNIANSFGLNGFSIVWNFFGSRHGKGESDGESAVVKSYLDNIVKSEQLTIHDATDVFNLLTRSARHIVDGDSRRHFYFSSEEAANDLRNSQSLQPLCPVPGVRALHQVVGGLCDRVQHKRLSCYCNGACNHSDDYKTFKYPGNFKNLFTSNSFSFFFR